MNHSYIFGIFLYIAFFSVSLHGHFQHYFMTPVSAGINKLQLYVLGKDDVSDALKKRAQEIFTIIGVPEPEKIFIKRMSPFLLSCAQDAGCIATHNALFVDEAWLESLPDNKVCFVLAHEAMHLKNKDYIKRTATGLGLSLLGITAVYNYKKLGVVGLGSCALFSAAAFSAVSRYQESNADAGAERIAPGAFSDHALINISQTPYQKAWGWLGSWFSIYPGNRFAVCDK